MFKLLLQLFQILAVDKSTGEVNLLYLKKEGAGLYTPTGETSWESISVIRSLEPNPEINPVKSRRRIVYQFPKKS
jgi:hypothetical protein